MHDVKLTPENIQAAIKRIGEYELDKRLDQVDGQEAHRVLPAIWPVIGELRLLADACKAGKLHSV